MDRLDRLDALRALAMLWMAAFHFAFDLNHFGLISPKQQFTADPFWTLQRSAIVSLFLFCAGAGQAIAMQRAQGTGRFWRRWAQVAGCALLVSAGSAWMFPRSWIFFGVLHGIAVMLLLVRGVAPMLAAPAGRLVLGALALLLIGLPQLWQHTIFDAGWLRWVGLGTGKPVTEDYVPLLPWAGVMLIGLLAGRWAAARGGAWMAGAAPAWLAILGRRPLSFYMLHQPLLIGITVVLKAVLGR